MYTMCVLCVCVYCDHPFDVIGSICAGNDAIILILYVHVYGDFYYYIEQWDIK